MDRMGASSVIHKLMTVRLATTSSTSTDSQELARGSQQQKSARLDRLMMRQDFISLIKQPWNA